jgi:hypothetical protein
MQGREILDAAGSAGMDMTSARNSGNDGFTLQTAETAST